jgi:integrase
MTAVVLAKRKLSEERLAQNRKKYLTHDEMKQVLHIVEGAGKPRPALCLEFLFLTGLRIGELLALQFEDYDA